MGLIAKDFDAFFLKTVTTLEPYLNNLVVVGGTANALLRYHPLSAQISHAPIGTKDLDLASERQLARDDRPPLDELLEKADLKVDLRGDGNPPVMKFVSATDATLDLELLCPARSRSPFGML